MRGRAPGRYAYRLLLVALLTCSSRADDAEDDHHPIMMACGVEVCLCDFDVVWPVRSSPRWEGARDGRRIVVAGVSKSYCTIRRAGQCEDLGLVGWRG